MTQYEVEQKFAVDDFAALERELAALGAEWESPIEQVDTYYAHPVRNFAQTDEALRIRRIGDQSRITYKGPKIDATTKTRVEIELPLAGNAHDAGRFGELLVALGFRPVSEVQKSRRSAHVEWQGERVSVDLDDVVGLGCYVELELAADDSQVAAAKAAIESLARRLDLAHGERRSYLELLLNK